MPENRYGVKFTPKASEDLGQIFSYISGELFTEIAAGNLMDRIEKSIMRLKKFPLSGSFVLDEPLKKRGYRKIAVDNYIIFYLVDEHGQQVVIMRIIYGARNYQDLL